MKFRQYIVLFVLGLGATLLVSAVQSSPGYMDADYYYATGLQLARGEGFNEPFLWNYLDAPDGVPHPSHGYWLPLPSLLALFGLSISGSLGFSGAKIGFIILAGLIPPLTAAIAYTLTERRPTAMLAGLFGAFSIFYLPYYATTDTFGLYMFFGGLFFVIPSIIRKDLIRSIVFGIIAGLMYLTRADALIWLLIALAFASYKFGDTKHFTLNAPRIALVLIGFFAIVTPWLIRNQLAFGTLLSPGGIKAAWFTSYNQLFAFPADQFGFDQWWSSGIVEILRVRWWALGQNVQTALAVQGGIFLTPFIVIGAWRFRGDFGVRLGLLTWLVTYAVMTLVFPFAGARGGFFHSGAALQPLLWALAAIGIDGFVIWGNRVRGWHTRQARTVFATAFTAFAVILSVFIVGQRVLGWGENGQAWDGGYEYHRQLNGVLFGLSISPDEIIMVNNPPGFYLASERPAIVIPDGDVDTSLLVAEKYQADYLILERNHPQGLNELYENPDQNSALNLLWSDDQTHIFAITDH